MRKLSWIVLAVLILLVTGAWAGDVQGKIQKVAISERMVILDDGTELWVPENLSMDALREGVSVKVSYEERNGKKVIIRYETSQ